MALYKPGKRSNKSMLLSGLWVITLLLTLVPGHLVLATYIWFHYDDGSNLKHVVELTGLSEHMLWLTVVISFFMDLWIALHGRQGHKKRKY
jgi:hypothetical protein